MRLPFILVLVTLLVACGAPPAAEPAAPQTTPPVAVERPTEPSAPAEPFASGALGLARAEFEATFGAPVSDGVLVNYGEILVMYLDDLAYNLTRPIDPPVAGEDAQIIARSLLPRDAMYVETYTAEISGSTVERYNSSALAQRFDPMHFIGGDPGDLIVIYQVDERGVFGLVVGPGNNP